LGIAWSPLVLPLPPLGSSVGIGARVGMTNCEEDSDEDDGETAAFRVYGAGFGECDKTAHPPRKLAALPVAIKIRSAGLIIFIRYLSFD
jgi:hypothetical protein